MATLYTIGYEGWGFDIWVDALISRGIRTVVDVRELPLSRRPGWSKRALAEKLAERGIGYVHMRALGTPAPMRHGLRDKTLPFEEFAPQFRDLLAQRPDDVDALVRLVLRQPVALMCWEEDPERCHRSLVAEAVRGASTEEIDVVDIRRMDRPDST